MFSIADEWLRKLANDIKEKDHAEAEKQARENEERALIVQHGPVLWHSFADVLQRFVTEITAAFHDDVTLREGPLSFAFRPPQGDQIVITKAAFPFASFTAVPQYSQGLASITYSVINPQKSANLNLSPTTMLCRFEVSENQRVFLQLDGEAFHQVDEAAKYVMEKLFTLK
jgi:hypothetical protein